MSDQQLLQILREEFGSLRSHVQDLSLGLARLEERLVLATALSEEVADLRARIDVVRNRLIVLTGGEGSDGELKALNEQVKDNKKKLESLMLSRAALAGYALASGGAAAGIIKLLM